MNRRMRSQLLRWSMASVAGVLFMGVALATAQVLVSLLIATPRWALPVVASASLTVGSLAALIGAWRHSASARKRRALPSRTAS